MSRQTMAATVKPRHDVAALVDFILSEPCGQYLISVHNGRIVKIAVVEKPKVVRRSDDDPPVYEQMRRKD